MALTVRTATLADLDAVTALEQACFPPAEAASRERMLERLTVFPNNCWLMFDGETLVSFVLGCCTNERDLSDEMFADASMHDDKGAWQMIFSVATLPEYQRRGLAERLLRHVTEEARRQGRRGLVLTCKDRLVHFYAKVGYVSEGVSSSEHGGAVWYQMRLEL